MRRRQIPVTLIVWRLLFGLPLNGEPKTNATWLFSGDKILPKYRKATRWAYLSGWQRMSIRWILFVGIPGFLYVFLAHRGALILIAQFIGALLFFSVLGGGVYVYRRMVHRRDVVRPIYRAIAGVAGLPPNPPNPGARLKIPIHYEKRESNVIRVNFDPDTWRGDGPQKKVVGDILRARLVGEWDVEYPADTTQPHALVKTRPHPPSVVNWELDLEDASAAADDATLVLGRDTRKELVSVSLDVDAPHIALSIGTGGGKSSTLRLIVVQLLAKGVEHIDIIDPKRVSLDCFDGHPRVTIHKSIIPMVTAVENFKTDMDARYEQIEMNKTLTFPRRVLLVEEGNSFMIMVEDWWEQVRAKSDPKKAPVIATLNMVLFQGRQANMNVISVFQRFDAKAGGGGAARDQYGIKILARFSPQAWRMLIGTTPWRSSKHRGRAVIESGDDPHWMQLGFISEDAAREVAFASENPVEKITEFVPEVVGKVQRFNLREIAEMELVPVAYASLRAAASRDKRFPEGKKGTYTRAEIVTWYNSRPSTTEPVALAAEA